MTDEVARIAAALRPIVNDWFDTGYEAGKLDADVLAERIAGLRLPDSRVDIAEPGLDAAWWDAERACPPGWIVAGVHHAGPSPMMRREFSAEAWGPWKRSSRSVDAVDGFGDTPAAALHALAAALRENRP